MANYPGYSREFGRGDHPYAQGFYAAMDHKDMQKNPYEGTVWAGEWLDGFICYLECCEAQTYEDDRL